MYSSFNPHRVVRSSIVSRARNDIRTDDILLLQQLIAFEHSYYL